MPDISMNFFGELNIIASQCVLDFAGPLEGMIFFTNDKVTTQTFALTGEFANIRPPRADWPRVPACVADTPTVVASASVAMMAGRAGAFLRPKNVRPFQLVPVMVRAIADSDR